MGDDVHPTKWVPGAAAPHDGTLLVVRSGEVVEAPPTRLAVGAVVTGRVVDVQGRGVGDVQVSVGAWDVYELGPLGRSATTSADGTFTITDVPTGSDVVQLTPPWDRGLAMGWVGGGADPARAPRQSFREGTTTDLGTLVIHPEAKLRVIVTTRPTGAGTLDVEAYAPGGAMIGMPVRIDDDAEAALLTLLPAGDVRLRLSWSTPDGWHRVPWWYQSAPSLTRSTPIQLRENETTTVTVSPH